MAASNFLPRLRRTAAKNLSIMRPVLRARISPEHVLPIVAPRHPVPRVQLVRPVRMGRRRVRPVPVVLAALAARGELNAQEVFPVLLAPLVPVGREVVPVVRPVRAALVAAQVVLAAHPVRA